MSRIVTVVLVVAGFGAAVASAEDKYVSEKGRFSATFPGKPNESAKEVETPIGKLTMQTVAFEVKKELGLIIIYVDYPDLIKQQKPQEVLARTRDGTKGLGDRIVEDKEIGDNAIPGREYVLAKEGGIYYRARVFLDGVRMYQVIVSGTNKDEVASPSATKFLDAFEITK